MNSLLYQLNMCIAADDYEQRIEVLEELRYKASSKIRYYKLLKEERDSKE